MTEILDSYDFIVAGAGSAGCALAARLADSPDHNVLLIEAGGAAKSLFVTMPAGNGFLFGNPVYDWGYESVPQANLGGRALYYPRGRGVGGSSNMNGMIYIRGNRADFDRWRQMGLDGWSYADVLPYFKRSENARHQDNTLHGHDGPLKITRAANFQEIDRAFVDAACATGAPQNTDFNGRSQMGAGQIDTNIFQGRRQSTVRAYATRGRRNLTILSDTTVRRIVLKTRRAVGVEVSGPAGRQTITAGREVILCLGVFGSPQLMMLSGMGPASHLQRFGIDVIADLPGVGSNLQDHPNMPMQFGLRDARHSLARYQRIDRAIWLGLRYLLRRDGPGAAPFWCSTLFFGLRDPTVPDIQVFFTPMIVTESPEPKGLGRFLDPAHLGRSILARGKNATVGFQFDVNLLRPRSRGMLRLLSPDPDERPAIDPAYFEDPADLDDLVAGVRHMRKVADALPISALHTGEQSPGPDVRSDGDMAAAVRQLATTGHHPVSTCRMARRDDPTGVLDAEFRVRGIDGLRVVDASAFPDQISGNPQAAIVMMAEKASDLILGRPVLAPEEILEAAE